MEIVATVLLIVIEIGVPVTLVCWLMRRGPLDDLAGGRDREIERLTARRIARQVRVECADLDREYARLIYRESRS